SSPAHLKYKVYIIDEAHQLTKEAFNALLKTLEEPPEHAVFVLATTSADKMPATILSRVQRFDFKKFSVSQIVEKLERIAKKEKVSADEDALRMIAYSAEGGLRDAESLFAQVLSRADAKVTEKTVREMLGIASPKQLSDLVDIIAEKNLSRAISYVNEFRNDGGSPEEFLKALVNYLRELMLVKIDQALRSAVAPELTDEQFSVMIAQSKRFEQADLSVILIALMEAQDNLKKTSQPLLPFELALMKMLGK
ncbi:MAG: polymerase III subunit gamma and tau protein, partial [Candidatus Giovannonibacteria bacterium GW2011_GWA2_44_26]